MAIETIGNQVKAMEAWAIQIRDEIKANNYSKVNTILGRINRQGRRLEWRGRDIGLKKLPPLKEVNSLKRSISEARTFAQRGIAALRNIDLNPKLENKTTAEIAAIKKKENKYKKELGESTLGLVQSLKLAVSIAEKKPWLDVKLIIMDSHSIEMFRRREEFYKYLDLEQYERICRGFISNKIIPYSLKSGSDLSDKDLFGVRVAHALHKINFNKSNLGEAKFSSDLVGVTFIGSLLVGASFSGYLNDCNFEQANLGLVNFQGSTLYEVKLKGADLRGAKFIGTRFVRINFNGVDLTNADIYKASFENVKNITQKQFQSAKNWKSVSEAPHEFVE